MFGKTSNPIICSKVSIFVALFCAAVFSIMMPQTAHAQRPNKEQVIDSVLDIFIKAGPALKIPITGADKPVLSLLINCLTSSDMVECAKNASIDQLPIEAQFPVRCALGGANLANCAASYLPPQLRGIANCAFTREPAQCVTKEGIKQLPPEAQSYATCLLETKSAAACAKAELLKQVSASERPFAQCIVGGERAEVCAARYGKTQLSDALNHIQTDSTDAPDNRIIGQARGPLNDIVQIVVGIMNNDWERIVTHTPELIVKIIGRYALTVAAAGAGGPIADMMTGPVVDAVVEHRFDLIRDIFAALKDKDPARTADVIINAYYTSFAVIPCAAIRTVALWKAIPDALCGLAGKIFSALGDLGGDIVGRIYEAIAGGLKELGVIDFFDRIDNIVAGDLEPGYCGNPIQYFAKYEMQCVRAAVTESIAATTLQAGAKEAANRKYREIVSHVHDGCRQWFEQCHNGTETLNKYCNGLIEPFTGTVEQTGQVIYDAGRAYSSKLVQEYSLNKGQLCDMQQAMTITLVQQCEDFLRKRFPMLPTPPVLWVNARGDAHELPNEHHFRKCTPSNYQMSTPRSAESMACSGIAQQISNICADRGTAPFVTIDITPDSSPPRVIVDTKNNTGLLGGGMTGEDAKTKFGNTHMTAVSLAARGELHAIDPRPHGGSYTTAPGVNVGRGITVRDALRIDPPVRTSPAVRNNPAVRNDPGIVIQPGQVPYGGMYSTAPNSQIRGQQQPAILYRRPDVVPRQQFQQPQRGAIGSRTTTFNVPKPTGGMNQTAPGNNQVRPILRQVGKPQATTPDQRMNYGSCSGCKPTPRSGGYPGLR